MTRTTNKSSAKLAGRASVAHRIASCLGLVAGVAASLTAVGCEEDFDPASKLNTLRVLAVEASNPYPKPGETVELTMLWHDGKSPPDSPRPVQVVWLGGCINPSGDLYYNCYEPLAQKLAQLEQDPSLFEDLFGVGDTFSVEIPEDIISSRPTVEDTDPYGMTYIFFAACAGEIQPAEPGDDGLPFGCFDTDGNRLGADDYVPGYLSLYSYEDRTNANPILEGLTINGELVDPNTVPTYSRCTDASCSDLEIRAVIDPASAETTDFVDGDGNPLSEQMWVEYLATGGEVESSPKLVNDATKGFNTKNETDYTPPSSAGKQYLFAVVRDNRGGVAWVQQGIVFE